MIDFLHERHYDKFSEYVEKIYEKFPKILENFVKNLQLPVLRVLPSDTLLTQFRKAPESAELTGSLLQPSPASPKGHLMHTHHTPTVVTVNTEGGIMHYTLHPWL